MNRNHAESLQYYQGYDAAFRELTKVRFVRHLSPAIDISHSRSFIQGWNQSLNDYRNAIKFLKGVAR